MPRDDQTATRGNNWRAVRAVPALVSAAAVVCAALGCGEASEGRACAQLPTQPPWLESGEVERRSEPSNAALRITEVQSRNEGTWIDANGETDDWLELQNMGSVSLRLEEFWLTDRSGRSGVVGSGDLAPGEAIVLFADEQLEQGCGHLPFELSGDGETLLLQDSAGRTVDELVVPAMQAPNVYARYGEQGWQQCAYASAGWPNPERCAPPRASVEPEVLFEPFEWPRDTFLPSSPVALGALHLRPAEGEAGWIQLVNRSERDVDLSELSVALSAHQPGQAWPSASAGVSLNFGRQVLSAGQRVAVSVSAEQLLRLGAPGSREAVVGLFQSGSESAVDRIDFMSLPPAAVIARAENGSLRLCSVDAEAGSEADYQGACQAILQREVGDRLRHLLTPGDFSALADGGTKVGIESVKFVHERAAPGLVHFLSAAVYPLHYTFFRRRISGGGDLDRCNAQQNNEFLRGWEAFSAREYRQVEGKTLFLGTLSKYGAADLSAVEYTFGDFISAAQMRVGMLEAVAHTQQPNRWKLRPQDETQVAKVRALEGQVPLAGPNAPFEGLTYQTLSEGVGYGTLQYIPAAQLQTASLGPRVILITDAVPNDIPLVGGLLTEAFQTPLAHVNVLSQSRGTPNASYVDASQQFAEWLGQVVRFEVSAQGIDISLADPEEAAMHWIVFERPAEPFEPRIDLELRGPQDLRDHGLDSLPALGAKASQLAELRRPTVLGCGSDNEYAVPERSFAVPVVHFVEHAERSGATADLLAMQQDTALASDSAARAAALQAVREKILGHPVEPALLEQVQRQVRDRFGEDRVRFRSSSNTEDLNEFSGAGLYSSVSAQWGDEQRSIADAMRGVWASLYNQRAYDERRLAGVQENRVAMGLLVHRAFRNERANGVAVSRNVLDPTRGDQYFFNVQAGEASVTNPVPGVTTEQLVYRLRGTPEVIVHSESSLLPALGPDAQSVLRPGEARQLGCALRSVHNSFRRLLDPQRDNPWFAMEVEFKFLGPERRLLLKQARPHGFGRDPDFFDCREF